MVAELDDAVFAQVVSLLRRSAQPTRIILFGSYARGDARPDSDVDLLVIVPDVRDRMAEMVRLSRVLSPLRLPVDVLVVSEETFRYWCDTPGNVYSTVAAEGRVLYEQAA
jgi:uncharacterized protein